MFCILPADLPQILHPFNVHLKSRLYTGKAGFHSAVLQLTRSVSSGFPYSFSASGYRAIAAAYRAAHVTRSCFQVISFGAWAWDSAPGPNPTQGMP